MPDNLTSTELTALGALIPGTLQEFIDDYNTDPDNSPAVQYYDYLLDRGFTSYPALAKDVACDSSAMGEFANNFLDNVADESGEDFSVGSNDWLEFQWEL